MFFRWIGGKLGSEVIQINWEKTGLLRGWFGKVKFCVFKIVGRNFQGKFWFFMNFWLNFLLNWKSLFSSESSWG